MRLRWKGPGHVRRVVKEGETYYEWGAGAAVVQDVPGGLAALLLTSPRQQFEVAKDEPLRVIITNDDDLVALAVAGIGSVADLLANTSQTRLRRVAKDAGLKPAKVKAWAKAARASSSGEEVES